ncbi:hypothetical protein [Amnibacterium sp.]|uniref:hypothetical protein n=1 Tax=Amnibacterium sp. TaxID=1872496 RepID=UPI003F7C90A2
MSARKQMLDLDGDGRADTIFFSGTTFGVKTASGALITTNAGALLTGGGDHHAWAKTMEAEPPVAVVDDGHTAVVFAIVGCRLVVPAGTNGKPYRFTLWGWGTYGTGVACVGSDRGGWMLAGVDAVRTGAGRYRIDTTEVDISKDGRTAKNGQTVKGTKTFAADSTEVAQAKESICTQVPRLTDVGK